MKKNRLSNRRLLARFLVPYLIILLMPILIGSFIYSETLQLVENDARKANLGMLEQISRTVDQRMQEMDGIIQQVLSNPKIQYFAQVEYPFDMSNTRHILETRKEMKSYNLYNNFLLSYFIAFHKNELVMGPDMTYTYQEFYKLVLKYDEKSYAQWRDEINAKYYKRLIMPAEPAQMYQGKKSVSLVTYVQSLNLSTASNATVMLLIDENEFKKLLGQLDISDGGWAYIADEKGSILSAVNKQTGDISLPEIGEGSSGDVLQQEADGSEMLTSYYVSPENSFRYVAVQPYKVVMGKVKYIKDMVLILTSVTILLGLMIASYLAYRNTKPVRDLIGRISLQLGGEGQTVRNEFDYIKETLSGLINNNALLQEEIKEQRPYLTAAFYSRLLKGDFEKEEDIHKLGRHIGLTIAGRYYGVSIVMLAQAPESISEERLDELNKSSLFIKKLLQSTIPQELHFFDVDEEKLSMILTFDGEREQAGIQMAELLQSIRNNLDKFGVNYGVLAAGGLYDTALNIPRSFSDAMRVLNISLLENNPGIILHQDSGLQTTGYFYPEEVEKRLMNLTRSGDKENVRKLLKEILNENLLNRKLSTEILTLFVYDIYGTLVKLVDQISPGNEELAGRLQLLLKFRETNELELFRSGLDLFSQICDVVGEQKKSHNSKLKENILQFVETRFMNPNVCLSMISEKYGLSEAYLSQFFKEQTGENFSSYLENVRIKKACELLSHTDLGINEIAVQVGYSSSNTFCKVFKRVNGVNATNYRRSLPIEGG